MSNISNEKLEAGFMLASYLDTLGFRNGIWEFNYGYKLNNIDIRVKSSFISKSGTLITGSKKAFSDQIITGISSTNSFCFNLSTIGSLFSSAKPFQYFFAFVILYRT